MTPVYRFGATLTRIRQERGFASSHAFYKLRDGRRNFQMTFRNYLNVEQGKNLPKPERVEAILKALGLEEHSAQARDLVKDYLADLDYTNLARFLRTDGGAANAGADFMEQASRRAIQEKIHLTYDQFQLLAKNYDAHLCKTLLQTTAGGLSIAEMAQETGLGAAQVKKAVAALVAAGFAKASGGKVRSVYENKITAPPPMHVPSWVGVNSAYIKNQQKMVDSGRLLSSSLINVRLTEADLRRVRGQIDQLIIAAGLYENQQKTVDSAVYVVRGQLFKLFPRKK